MAVTVAQICFHLLGSRSLSSLCVDYYLQMWATEKTYGAFEDVCKCLWICVHSTLLEQTPTDIHILDRIWLPNTLWYLFKLSNQRRQSKLPCSGGRRADVDPSYFMKEIKRKWLLRTILSLLNKVFYYPLQRPGPPKKEVRNVVFYWAISLAFVHIAIFLHWGLTEYWFVKIPWESLSE